jgi:hypothetical protein
LPLKKSKAVHSNRRHPAQGNCTVYKDLSATIAVVGGRRQHFLPSVSWTLFRALLTEPPLYSGVHGGEKRRGTCQRSGMFRIVSAMKPDPCPI